MGNNAAVIYSFCLYVLYVLLPLVPAILIFKLFPETKVTVSGPLQNLTINATGAFAAYVVTVALGFFLVRDIETEIHLTRLYAVEGVILDLAADQNVDSDQFYSRYILETSTPNSQFPSRDYYFVVLLAHPPIGHPETVTVKYWEVSNTAGTGSPPPVKWVTMKLLASDSSPLRFRLRRQNGIVAIDSAD